MTPTDEASYNDIVIALAKDMGLELEEEDISISHPLPTYNKKPNKEADPKMIVKFTRPADRDDFYANKRKIAGFVHPI